MQGTIPLHRFHSLYAILLPNRVLHKSWSKLIPEWFRLFVGDLSNDVNERTLDAAFNKYPSFCKCKVVRDRLSEKVREASFFLVLDSSLLSRLSELSPTNLRSIWRTGEGMGNPILILTNRQNTGS